MNGINADQARILALSAPILLDMFRKQEADVWAKAYGEFKQGKTDFLVRIAEFAAIRDQINNINAVLRAHDKGES